MVSTGMTFLYSSLCVLPRIAVNSPVSMRLARTLSNTSQFCVASAKSMSAVARAIAMPCAYVNKMSLAVAPTRRMCVSPICPWTDRTTSASGPQAVIVT